MGLRTVRIASMARRTALITGATGGLGPAVVGALAADGWRVVAPHRPGSADRLPAAAVGVEADLTDAGAVARAGAVGAAEPGAPLGAGGNLVGGDADGPPGAGAPGGGFGGLVAVHL